MQADIAKDKCIMLGMGVGARKIRRTQIDRWIDDIKLWRKYTRADQSGIKRMEEYDHHFTIHNSDMYPSNKTCSKVLQR